MQEAPGQTYQFQAEPKVVKPRAKYREAKPMEEEDGKIQQTNLMFDKRVVRGNTYAAIVSSKNVDQLKDTAKIQKSLKRDIQKPKEQQEIQKDNYEPGTPPAVVGRNHVEVQTDEFVETLTDKPPEYEKDTQTDFYIDRPVVRLFMPKKNGIDKESQIWDDDLFDFDYEAEPILQVLIGKTLEQSRMEVLEEEELRVMKEQQKHFEQLKNAEMAETQKLEQKEKRLHEENERRKLQYRKKREQNIFSHQKMISRQLAKNYLSKMKPQVFDIMEDCGMFRNPLEMSLYDQLLPWLYQQVQQDLQSQEEVKVDLSSLLGDITNDNRQHHKQGYDSEMKRRAELIEKRRQEQLAREERRRLRELEKKRKAELERRAKLRDKANDVLLSKAEQKEKIFSNLVTDIDGCQQEAPFIGLFGGLFGEVVLYSQCLKQIVDQQGDKYQVIKDHLSNPENVVSLFKEVLAFVLQAGSVGIAVNEAVDAQIAVLDPALNITNWQLADQKIVDEVYKIIIKNMTSQTLNAIKKNADALGITEQLVDSVIQQLLKQFYNDDTVQQKIKFIKVQPKATFDQAGICFMQPDLSAMPVSQKSERAGQMQEPQVEGEEPKPVVPLNIAETDFEDKAKIFNPNSQEISVLVQHNVAETILREEMLKNVAGKNLETNEFALLIQATQEMKELQKKVMDFVVPDFPVFDMKSY